MTFCLADVINHYISAYKLYVMQVSLCGSMLLIEFKGH